MWKIVAVIGLGLFAQFNEPIYADTIESIELRIEDGSWVEVSSA